MMVTQRTKARIQALERRYPPEEQPRVSLFLRITDASVPEPGEVAPKPDYTDAAIVAARTSLQKTGAQRIERNPGESIPAFMKRASKAFPESTMFFFCYRCDEPALTTP